MANFEKQSVFVLRADNGDVIATYDKINRQENGITFAYTESKKWCVVDKDGKETISGLESIDNYEKNGYATFNTYDGHQGAIDKDGKIAIQPIFRSFWGFNKNGIAIVTYDDSTCNLINTSGETLFSENYPNIIGFENGYFNICNFDICNTEGLHALANPDGKLITPFRYKEIYKCANNLFTAALDNGEVVINAEGKEITAEHNFIRIMPNGIIVTYDAGKTLTIFDKTGTIQFVKKYDKSINYSATIQILSRFFENHPYATVTDGKLTIPWEHLGI